MNCAFLTVSATSISGADSETKQGKWHARRKSGDAITTNKFVHFIETGVSIGNSPIWCVSDAARPQVVRHRAAARHFGAGNDR
jgi:hypothetical protein